MEHYKCIWMPIKLIPQSFINEYDLQHKFRDSFVYMEIQKKCMDSLKLEF